MLNELNLTPELLEKAKSATSATELLALAQENDITLTTEEATTYYSQLHPKEGALSDDELDNVSGGCGWHEDPKAYYAIIYAQTTYCDKNPRCFACHAKSPLERLCFLDVAKIQKKLCPGCSCKPEIDAHCISMGWPTLEFATYVPTTHEY